MICSNCGKENNPGAAFCYNCGSKLKVSQPTYRQQGPRPMAGQTPHPAPMQPQWNGPMYTQPQEPKKKTSVLILIICIIVLCLAIIGGVIALVVIGGNKKKQVDNFKAQVEDFEEFLEDVNYSSVQDDVIELMEDCEAAINSKSVEDFDKLLDEIRTLRLKLGDISDDIDSLEQLKHDYEILFDENYVIPEDMLEPIEELFEEIHEAVKDGETKKLKSYKSELDKYVSKLNKNNQELIDGILRAVEQMNLSEITDEERDELDLYVREIEEYVDMNNYRLAFDKALMYEAYAYELEEKTANRLESEEESRRQSEDAKRQEEGDYICPGSDSRYLTEADLAGLSAWELLLARNEIFARHGRKFVDDRIQSYFDSKDWYNGTVHPDDFDLSVFNQYELANIDFIKSHE